MTGNRPYDDDLRDGYTGRRAAADADREISLGMPTILGIFFALALALAAVFGLGYTLGRRSAEPAAELTDNTLAPSLGSASKPSAGMSGQPTVPAAPPAADATAPAAPVQTATVPLNPPADPKHAVTPADGMVVGDKPPTPSAQPATSNLQPATSFIVQVAAVSSQDVADILTSSLQKKGYTIVVRHEPQDKLLHVQIGPFTDRKDAVAMQQRVLADGFNAIVK
ncbi:MAG: SPOR domain-containing protein [Acidobacteriaceae bacterium]|jgi:cell division septation protein DedD